MLISIYKEPVINVANFVGNKIQSIYNQIINKFLLAFYYQKIMLLNIRLKAATRLFNILSISTHNFFSLIES